MGGIYFFFVVGLVIVFGEKHCHKPCLSDTDCDHGKYCRFDLEGCHSECMSSKNDLPPPVIGKRNTGCSQVPMFCPQPCMVNKGGCTVCDCTGGIFSTGQNSPFHATNLGNPVQLSQMGPMSGQGSSGNQMGQMSAQSNPANTGPGSGSLNGPNTPNFNPSNPGNVHMNPSNNGGSLPNVFNGQYTGPIQNGGPGGTKLDQILSSTLQPSSGSQTSTLAPTTIKTTCAPVRCIAPCNKGVTISKDGCPTCLC
ncbi:unnamed protein product [Mytilus coruscus]|uniref:Antistasin-like domain-containing protein n=1 Tax=Mytilus coruscus TaxID=42192 RepID=A0A6J7ZZ28_MYTCO|nr:unnamed protein product [Mytilus coruscus]